MDNDTIDTRVGFMTLSIIRKELLETMKLYDKPPLKYIIQYNRIDLYLKSIK